MLQERKSNELQPVGVWDLMAMGKWEKENVGSRAATGTPGMMPGLISPRKSGRFSPQPADARVSWLQLSLMARASSGPHCAVCCWRRGELLGKGREGKGRVRPGKGAGGEEQPWLSASSAGSRSSRPRGEQATVPHLIPALQGGSSWGWGFLQVVPPPRHFGTASTGCLVSWLGRVLNELLFVGFSSTRLANHLIR